MLNSIFFQSIFVSVVIEVCSIKNPVISKLRFYILWAAIAANIYNLLPLSPNNYYSMLGVSPKCSKTELIQAYKKSKLIHHPDKNLGKKDSEENFIRIRKAYEILIDDSKKTYYERFGEFKKDGEIDEKFTVMVIGIALANQIFLFIVAYMCTLRRKAHFARQLMMLYNIGVFCLELRYRFVDKYDPLDWIPHFSNFVAFEKIELLRRLFPSVLGLSILWSNYTYEDKDELNIHLLKKILSTSKVISDRMVQLSAACALLSCADNAQSQNGKFISRQKNENGCIDLRNNLVESSIELRKIELSHTSESPGVDDPDEDLKTQGISERIIESQDCVARKTSDLAKNVAALDKSIAWRDFLSTLSTEQKTQLIDFLARNGDKIERKESRSMVQSILWIVIIMLWIYYK